MAATLTCLQCGGDLGAADRFCAHCGAESFACAGCGRPLLSSDLSCPDCGTPAAERTPPDDPAGAHADSQWPWTDMIERLRRATLGEYEIGRELGRGGMAAVFLAHEISLDRKVAIKVMSPGLMLGDGMVDRFKHEAITIAQLHHPNIVSVYSVRRAEGLHFFVMRYVQGRSLEQVIRRAGQLPLAIVRSIVYQVGSALTYAHRSGVIHRDIKPANILIDADGNAIVTDFGIAKAAERPTQTLTGALVGTPAYMSPEQCSGGEVSWASDQYSLGAVAYEMVTGLPPFAGSTLTVMQAHVERDPTPIREHCPECPPEMEAAILRMLAKEADQRFPRMADAMAALSAAPLPEDDSLRAELARWAIPGLGPSLTGAPTPTSPPPRTRASGGWSESGRPVGGISIVPAPSDLEVGDSFTLAAVIRGQHGTRMPPRSVTWTTDAPGILRLDGAAGMATAVAAGSALLTATCRGVSALLRVEVASPRADDIVIGPMNEPLHVGDETRLDATPRDKRGWPVSRAVIWQSADPSIARVSADGAIAGRGPGTVRITALLDDARATIVIPVLPARVAVLEIAEAPGSLARGQHLVLTANPLDRMNQPLAHRAIAWSTSDASVVTVDEDGRVTAAGPGSAVVTASCEAVSASVRITVSPPAETEPAHTPIGRPPRRRHSRRAARRRVLLAAATTAAVVAVFLWLRLRPSPLDEAAAIAPAVTASIAEPVTDSVVPASVVIVRRPPRALRPNAVARLAAEVRDATGRVVPGAGLVWSSSDSTIVRVDPPSGRIRAVRPGRAQIVAANESRRDSVLIAVRNPGAPVAAVASIAIAPLRPLRIGDSLQLQAVVVGAKGDTVDGMEVEWGSSDARVVRVDPSSGVARAQGPGTALILARSGGASTLSELRVVPGTVAALEILGGRPMAVRETLALRLEAVNALGDRVAGPPAIWRSSDSTIADINESSGVVAALAPGSALITATSEGATGRLHLTILPRPQRVPAAPGVEYLRAQARVQAGVEGCYAALRSKSPDSVSAVYHPESKADRDKLKRLNRILGTNAWAPVVEERVDREPKISADSASMEFSIRMMWEERPGERITSHPVFRADFVRTTDGWRMSSCRIVGSPRL